MSAGVWVMARTVDIGAEFASKLDSQARQQVSEINNTQRSTTTEKGFEEFNRDIWLGRLDCTAFGECGQTALETN